MASERQKRCPYCMGDSCAFCRTVEIKDPNVRKLAAMKSGMYWLDNGAVWGLVFVDSVHGLVWFPTVNEPQQLASFQFEQFSDRVRAPNEPSHKSEWEKICDEISAACVDKIIGESVVDYITELEEIKRRYNAT